MTAYLNDRPERRGLRSTRLLIPLIILLALFPGIPAAQIMMRDVGSQFDLSVSQGFNEGGGAFMLVNISIDYRRLVFFKKEGYYESKYRIFVDIRDSRDKRVRGEVWEETVTVAHYEETRSPTMRVHVMKKFASDAGEFRIDAKIEVLGTSLKYESQDKIRIVGGKDNSIGISDPIFLIPEKGGLDVKPVNGELAFSLCSYNSREGFSILAGGVYLEFDSWLRMAYGLIQPDTVRQSGGLSLAVRITDSYGNVIAYNRQKIPVTEGAQGGFCLGLDVDRLPIGYYVITVKADIPGTDIRTTKEDRFMVLLNGGLLSENFPEMLEILSLVADESELEDFRNAPAAEREDQWYRFWRKRDPTGDTTLNENMSEFLRRLRFSITNFSKKRSGWKTDMGKVYIGHGAPDRITDRTGTQFDYGSDYQLWYYDSRGIVYVFMRDIGSGEYRLVDTQML